MNRNIVIAIEYVGLLRIISPLQCTRLWRSNSNDDEGAHISQFKASSIPIPEHTTDASMFGKERFSLDYFPPTLMGILRRPLHQPATVRQPLCSLQIEKLLQPTFQMAPPRSPARFFSLDNAIHQLCICAQISFQWIPRFNL